ncbi:hypothetical protein [Arthrobacter sp. zg-Y1143]|nr:hypothetical protein [Arthrobacter sp. zg-Y1143]MDK1328279.1 hypothetical protein [Arthrobacter sp. zg-Y1143]
MGRTSPAATGNDVAAVDVADNDVRRSPDVAVPLRANPRTLR